MQKERSLGTLRELFPPTLFPLKRPEREVLPMAPEGFCDGCPGPQPRLDCEFCDESEGAKEERRAAVRERGGN